MSTFVPRGMGWQPDLPDPRDYTCHHPRVFELLRRLGRQPDETLPDHVDLSHDCEGEYFTEPRDQGSLNSSTAFAVLSLVEYFERRIHGRTFNGSARFLYKVTRNVLQKRTHVAERFPHSQLAHSSNDTGADIRTTLKVLTQIGVPPEEYYPYDIDHYDEEPSAFHYALAKPFSNLRYFRLDKPNSDGDTTWATVKSFLAAGFPIVFGFPVPSSLTADPNIPYRPDFDAPQGGQAALAIGYRLNRDGLNQDALLIRTSWGSQWADNGNAWLPVAFLRNQLTRDFWTLISKKWLGSSELYRPAVVDSHQKMTRKYIRL